MANGKNQLSLNLLWDQYQYLDTNFNNIFKRCTTDEERNALRDNYTSSRDNYWEARARVFAETDPTVARARDSLKAANTQMKQDVASLAAISKTLNSIAAAVSVGAKLVTLGSAPI